MSHAEPPSAEERCVAMLKYVWRWRCTRRATSADGLCEQHRRLGAIVPERWQMERNDHGVDVPTPIGRLTQ